MTGAGAVTRSEVYYTLSGLMVSAEHEGGESDESRWAQTVASFDALCLFFGFNFFLHEATRNVFLFFFICIYLLLLVSLIKQDHSLTWIHKTHTKACLLDAVGYRGRSGSKLLKK